MDHMVQGREQYWDEVEASKAKIEVEDVSENYCIVVGNATTEEQPKFKIEAGDKDEADDVETEAKSGLENCYIEVRNILTEEELA